MRKTFKSQHRYSYKQYSSIYTCTKQDFKLLTRLNYTETWFIKPVNKIIINKTNNNKLSRNIQEVSSHEILDAKAILKFLSRHKLYESVHMYFHPRFRPWDHKLMDSDHFYNIVENKTLYHERTWKSKCMESLWTYFFMFCVLDVSAMWCVSYFWWFHQLYWYQITLKILMV